MDELFNEFKKISERLELELLEISVRQHQISYIFAGSTIGLQDIETLTCITQQYNVRQSYLLTAQEENFIICTFEKWEDENSPFKKYIMKIAENVCQCPALEFVVCGQYVKCFLDKGGLTVDDLVAYEKVMGTSGTLEMTPPRPYMLFINENYYLEEFVDEA